MQSFTKQLLLVISLSLGGFLLTAFEAPKSAQADDWPTCEARAGYLDFSDHSRCGYVAGNNSNWGALPGGWDNRAEMFDNHGRTHNVCLYDAHDYKGKKFYLPRGYGVYLPGKWVSSNEWTTATSCP
jgi:hypothetical protein